MKANFVFFRENFEKKTTQLEDLCEDLRELLRKFVTKDMVESFGFDIWKYHNVEKKLLTIGSLYPSDEVRVKNPNLHLDSLLEENSKKEEPDDFFVMACGKKEVDEEIWRQVSQFPKNATMLYESEKGFMKVAGIRKSYFEGEEVFFPKKEAEKKSCISEKDLKNAEDAFRQVASLAPENIFPEKRPKKSDILVVDKKARKVIVILWEGYVLKGADKVNVEKFSPQIKEKFEVEEIEFKYLNPDSLYAFENDGCYRESFRLDALLEKNNKKDVPDQFLILACGDLCDKEIWEQVKKFPKDAIILFPTENGLKKVDNFQKFYDTEGELLFKI